MPGTLIGMDVTMINKISQNLEPSERDRQLKNQLQYIVIWEAHSSFHSFI